ncbi:MAG: right-handed parallel beta-helix repeat-containing protein [Acidobacteriota bacterium]|nr:right-handed parallel beta-helix repeat-containing protein [Acidobacteriota bacterium]
MKKTSALFLAFAMISLPGLAQTDINQTLALAGGITSCDTPGFPVSICDPGSYKLSSNLDTSGLNAIRIESDDVYIDLNGFTILSSITPPTATGITINGGRTRTTVVNGTVTGFIGGLSLFTEVHVEKVNVIGNSGDGILYTSGRIINCTIARNGGNGIKAAFGDSGIIRDNFIRQNTLHGIRQQFTSGGLILNNHISSNGDVGLGLDTITAYGNNNLFGNNSGGVQVTGGVQLGINICSLVPCP